MQILTKSEFKQILNLKKRIWTKNKSEQQTNLNKK
jgi:hypothetical protein